MITALMLLAQAAHTPAHQPPIDNKTQEILRQAAASIGTGQNTFIKILGAHVEGRSIVVDIRPVSPAIEPSVLSGFPSEKWTDLCGQPRLMSGMDTYKFTIEMRLTLTSGSRLSTILTPTKCRELVAAIVPAEATAATPVQVDFSPLKTNAQLLADAPSEVQFEFLRRSIPNYGVTQREFQYWNREQRIDATLKAYYLQSLKKALLLYNHDGDLAGIINSWDGHSSPEETALNFEKVYRAKYGAYPPMVPVDLASLMSRMLDQQTVR